MDSNKMPLVSIVVPIYNAEKYLKGCLDSLWEQSYRPLEIILVDDGSTDLSGKICDSYSALSSVIKVVHTCNQGRTKARLTGVENASGEFISFVDADDYIAPTYVEHLVKCLFEQEVDISCCQCFQAVGNHNSYFSRTENGRFDRDGIVRLLTHNFLYDERSGVASIPLFLWGKLFKKECISQALPSGEDLWYGEDMVTFFYILQRANSIYFSKEAHYYYRQHDTQTIKQMERPRWDMNIKLFQTFASIDQDNYLREQLPLRILSQLREWLVARHLVSNSFGEFKADMVYALNNETMENYFMHKNIATSNKRHRILAFLAQHKMYFLYYMFLKVHLATLRFRG